MASTLSFAFKIGVPLMGLKSLIIWKSDVVEVYLDDSQNKLGQLHVWQKL